MTLVFGWSLGWRPNTWVPGRREPALHAGSECIIYAVDGGDAKKRWREHGADLSLILWAVWDPIGAGVPLDEYESYAPGVWRLLEDGASEDDIASHLGDVRERAMGIGGPEDDRRAASKLWHWWYWRFEANQEDPGQAEA